MAKNNYDLSDLDNLIKAEKSAIADDDVMETTKRVSTKGREKLFNYGRKWNLILVLIFLAILILELEIYEGIVIIKDFIKVEANRNPLVIFANAIMDHPLILMVMIIISYIASAMIVKHLKNRQGVVEDERGIILDETNASGASRLMTDKEKRDLFTYLDYNHPEGNILAVDKKSKELITVPFEDPKGSFSNRNIGLFGPPGMRKSSGILIPNIFSNIMAGNSVVCSDPKGELYKETYAAARYFGYNVRVFNIMGKQFKESDGWDCLKIIRESPSPQTTAQIFANILLSNTSGKAGDDFWWDANINCCMLVLLYVAKAKSFIPFETRNLSTEVDGSIPSDNYEKQRTIKEVYALLTDEKMKDIIKQAIAADPMGDGKLLQSAFNIWATHKEAESIKAGLGIRLNILQSEEVADILSIDDIDFKELADEKTIIYVVCADNDDTYKALLTLFVTFMFREITAYADTLPNSKLPRPLFVILEECGNIGKIPNLARYVSTVRSRNIGMLFCFQTLGQMKDIYGATINGKYEWETILAGCSLQLCLGGNDETTAEYFSNRSGTMSTINIREGEHRNKLFPEAVQKVTVLDKNQQTTIGSRPTMFADEILHIKKHEILISPATDNVTLEHKYFYKDHPLFNIILIDKETGEIVPEHLTKDHMPSWRRDGIPDNQRFIAEVGNRKSAIIATPSDDSSESIEDTGRSYTAFIRKQ